MGILTWGLMLFASVAYRRRRGDDTPKQLRYNIPIEVLYTVTPIAMVLALVFFTVRDEAQLTKVSNDQAETVNVTGFRWSWTFYYADQDVYDTGIPSLQDEAALPVLWLPVDEKVQFHLGSPDVIHSFWVPDFLFKLDVIPGRDNVFEVTPMRWGRSPASAPSCAGWTTPGCCSTSRWSSGPSSTSTWPSSRPRARPATRTRDASTMPRRACR